jgi:membrane-bound serine protease (ClpP class)
MIRIVASGRTKVALAGAVASLGLTFGAPAPAGTTAPSATKGQSSAAIISIEGEINDVTFSSLKRRVELARQRGANLLILEMNTPGGLVSSALEICTYLKNITEVRTVAWVNPSAFSAGAMISLACDEVVMASASKMGDCAPIVISPTEGIQELGKTERAKAESPILKEFLDSSNRRHYEPLLCEAMVRPGLEIWWLEKGDGGERKFVRRQEKEKLLAESGTTWRLVEEMADPVSGGHIAVRQPVVDERDLLTLTQTEAVAFGFARGIASSDTELKSLYKLEGPLARFSATWSEQIADFLSSPIVRTILMMLIGLGIYAEFNAPGHFVGAVVALVALAIFLGAPYITGLADMWEILLVVLGVALLSVEVFVLPGFGIAGILGILLVFVGLIATFVPAEPGPIIVPRLPGTWLGLKTGLQVVFGGLALAIAGMWLLNKYLPHLPLARGLLLNPPMSAGAAAGGPASSAALQSEAFVRLGDTGRTLTRLRPAGKALVGGRRVDVIAQGQMIDEDRMVEVVETTGGRVVVREVRQA